VGGIGQRLQTGRG